MRVGIVGYGVYLPKYRLKREEIGSFWKTRGRGENCISQPDEDIYTMAVESALNAVSHSGLTDLSKLGMVYLGVGSSPCLENTPIGILADCLDLSKEIDLCDFTSSTRASFAGLKCCVDAINSGRKEDGLVIASECRKASLGSPMELYGGCGAAGLVLGKEGVIAEIEEMFTLSGVFYDRWSTPAEPSLKEYEPRFTQSYGYHDHIVKAVKAFLSRTGLSLDDFDHAAIHQFDTRNMKKLEKSLGLKPDRLESSNIFEEMGDVGAASAFIKLCAILDKANAGERILVVGYGAGICDVISLKVTSEIEKKRGNLRRVEEYLKAKDYIAYNDVLRRRDELRTDKKPFNLGVPPTSPSLWRDGESVRRLKGAKCKGCGYVNYPPSLRKICVKCGGVDFEETKLPTKGKVYTFCFNVYLPDPMVGPQPVIIGNLDDGNRFRAFGTEFALGKCDVGMDIELVIRKIIGENGVSIYGYCFKPVRFNKKL